MNAILFVAAASRSLQEIWFRGGRPELAVHMKHLGIALFTLRRLHTAQENEYKRLNEMRSKSIIGGIAELLLGPRFLMPSTSYQRSVAGAPTTGAEIVIVLNLTDYCPAFRSRL